MKSKLLKQASACRKEFALDISKIILYNVPKGSTFKMFGTKVGRSWFENWWTRVQFVTRDREINVANGERSEGRKEEPPRARLWKLGDSFHFGIQTEEISSNPSSANFPRTLARSVRHTHHILSRDTALVPVRWEVET